MPLQHLVSAYVDVTRSSIIVGGGVQDEFAEDVPEQQLLISAPRAVLLLSSFDAHFARVNLHWSPTPVSPDHAREFAPALPEVSVGEGGFSLAEPDLAVTTIDADVADVVIPAPRQGAVSVTAVRASASAEHPPVFLGDTQVPLTQKNLEEWHVFLAPRWLCRWGSPVRESQCSNTAAVTP